MMMWCWLRTMGCFVSASLLLAFSTVGAGAHQQQLPTVPQQPPAPQQECFTVVMARANPPAVAVGAALGAVLLNRCTGNTWILTITRGPKGSAPRWHPITVESTEYVSAP